MQKISEALIESEGVRRKIFGILTHLDEDGNIDGYCALGALGCAKGLNMKKPIGYEQIIRSYGVDPDTKLDLPSNNGDIIPDISIISLIYILNDRKRIDGNKEWSFKKIGEYIKKLEDEGKIKYEN